MHHSASVRWRLVLAALSASLAAPAGLAAQNRFEVTPWIGSYFTVADFYNDDFDLSNIPPLTGTTNITVTQENTAMYGLRVSVPVGATFAMEGSFGYARSNIRFIVKDPGQNGGFDFATNGKGNVIIGSLRAVIKPRRSNLSLILGGIVVNHGGDFWDDPTIDGKLTNFGGVAGIGLRANVTPRFPISIRAEGNFYNFNPDKGDNALNGFYPGKFQSDLIFSVGIPIGPR